MNFQNMKSIEDYQVYLDVALRKGEIKSKALRSTIRLRSVSKLIKSKRIEIDKIKILRDELCSRLHDIHSNFPSIDSLPEFYRQLIELTLDVDNLKKALASISWAEYNINKICCEAMRKLKVFNEERDIGFLNKLSGGCIGRVSSILKQVDKFLKIIEKNRKIMKNYPAIKTTLFTVAIAGFPNVGKSTLLSQVTNSEPEINDYPFTTRKLNTGYFKHHAEKIQLIDTPGTLARFNKMNDIEKQADIAMKYAANMTIYVFDLTEQYPIKDQFNLLDRIIELEKPIIIYLSKKDILDKKQVADFIKDFQKKYKYQMCENGEELIKQITQIKRHIND